MGFELKVCATQDRDCVLILLAQQGTWLRFFVVREVPGAVSFLVSGATRGKLKRHTARETLCERELDCSSNVGIEIL